MSKITTDKYLDTIKSYMKSRLEELGLNSSDLLIQVTNYEPAGRKEYI